MNWALVGLFWAIVLVLATTGLAFLSTSTTILIGVIAVLIVVIVASEYRNYRRNRNGRP